MKLVMVHGKNFAGYRKWLVEANEMMRGDGYGVKCEFKRNDQVIVI